MSKCDKSYKPTDPKTSKNLYRIDIHTDLPRCRKTLCWELSCSVMSDSSVTPWTVASQAPLSPGILQARVLQGVAMSFSKGFPWPRDATHVSCMDRLILYHCSTWEPRGWKGESKIQLLEDFPGDPVVKTPCCQCRGEGSIPYQGIRIPHASGHGQKNFKEIKRHILRRLN